MRDCEEADIDHCFAEGRFDDAVTHADDEEEEKGERVAAGVEDGDDYQHNFRQRIGTVVVLVVIEAPSHEIFDN